MRIRRQMRRVVVSRVALKTGVVVVVGSVDRKSGWKWRDQIAMPGERELLYKKWQPFETPSLALTTHRAIHPS
ncbi:hypothetical protein VTJ04DRAFT_10085 [Mycothermus thermophilus]|uniref:uncharacterized protein n=1 Tax=Humicola insolens TaxID=85995 RepID=UPI003743A331